MADEASRAAKAPTPTTKSEFSNVEFLDSSLLNPLNVLRAKLKELSEFEEGNIRRVLIITEVITEDGRGLDVVWSENDDESSYVTQDSVISALTRVRNAVAGGDDYS